MIVRPNPNTNPLSTGFDINSETAPRRSRPPSRNINPAAIVAADTSSKYRAEPIKAIGATKAASIAAEDEVAVTASWRDVPKMAYTNIPSNAAYKPTCGGTPA